MTLPMGRAMREVFGETVAAMADEDPRIVMLDGDLGSSTKAEIFERAHPERFLPMGIAEQNMLGVAAGLATMGLIPYISTFVSFALIRPLDQIRVLIAQTGLPVKITAGYAGLFTGMAGKTHQVVDDVSIARAMPGIVVVSPADDIEAAQVLRWSAEHPGPVYIRLVRDATQRLFDESYAFRFGEAVVVREGGDVTLLSTGAQTPRVVDAADLLADAGIQAHVVHLPTIKPMDVGAVVSAAERTGRVITIEEHTVIGGLGGAVAEILSEHRPTRVDRIGLPDIYTESGPNDALLDLYGLSATRVAEQVRRTLDAG
ncbi:MAG TPA: transketolase C-terminal domain-containing protein [Candidatus Limnocylindrales bacterium]|nr:transketolase C-terminal domain-containing protein [Candidatus Limnocylindrales bacterium]